MSSAAQDPLHNANVASSDSPSAGTRRFSWGIFDVIYDYPTRIFTQSNSSLNHRNLQSTLRFLRELHTIAPRPFAVQVSGCLWMSVSPALSLYLSYAILDIFSVRSRLCRHRYSLTDMHQTQTSAVTHHTFTYCGGFVLQIYIGLWLLSAMVSIVVDCIL